MKSVKRTLKLIGFVVLLLLASIGIGMSGAILPNFRRQETPEIKIELVESKNEETDMTDMEENKN